MFGRIAPVIEEERLSMPPPWPCESEHTELEAALRELEDLRATLRTRPVIEQAKGILMAQHHCDSDAAFAMLRSASMRDNRKLHEIARCIVAATSAR
jgi:AmiR/NasT family two-component response regulator